ncbi:hypothetical protein BDQ17DRAFT_423048 [Cyathus striatus]|nr:hypothetical protein BDQ17DRAFT_423048 [Cyathus striatus]
MSRKQSNKTPWTGKASVLPSDRLPPRSQAPALQSASKGKARDPPEPPKSREVQRLEKIIKGIRSSDGTLKDPKGGCFCQARTHSLSTFSPICFGCGLILCEVNLPQYCCPHCSKPLLNTGNRESILSKLDSDLASTIAKEIAEREAAVREARQAVGEFPSLPGGPQASFPPPGSAFRPANETRAVLSLGSKGGKKQGVKVSTFTTVPAPTRPVYRKELEEEEPNRIPPPPKEVPHAVGALSPSRPWENLANGILYVYPSKPHDGSASTSQSSSRRRRKKGKGKENDSVVENQTGDTTSVTESYNE